MGRLQRKFGGMNFTFEFESLFKLFDSDERIYSELFIVQM